MRIDGRALAQKILDRLKEEIKILKIKPRLAIVLVGEEPVWETYVRQKELKAREIGAQTTRYQLPMSTTTDDLLNLLNDLNHLNKVHGIIVQRPLPPQIDRQALALAIDLKKDVDGFHPNSPYPMPVAEAVMRILREISLRGVTRVGEPHAGAPRLLAEWETRGADERQDPEHFIKWLKSGKIVVIGKGETAGQPVINALQKLGVQPEVTNSKTPHLRKITKTADIIISCVGKPEIIKPEMIKQGVILIGVGIYKDKEGRLHGDYNEEEIKGIASFYTPTPGGIGPLNVACLLENLVRAAKRS